MTSVLIVDDEELFRADCASSSKRGPASTSSMKPRTDCKPYI